MVAARQFFEGAIDLHGVPEKTTIDRSASNTAAIQSIRDDSGVGIELRQSKYLNNVVEQDHQTTGRSNASFDPCSASRRFAAREP